MIYPYRGPEGDKGTKYRRTNMWCALIMGMDWSSRRTLYVLSYERGHPVNCPGIDGMGTHIYMIMNDEPGKYGDNHNHPSDPRRVF